MGRTLVLGALVVLAGSSAGMAAGDDVSARLHPPLYEGVMAYREGRYAQARDLLEAVLADDQPRVLSERQELEAVHYLAGTYWHLDEMSMLHDHADEHLDADVAAYWRCMAQERAGADDAARACWQAHGEDERTLRVLRSSTIDRVFFPGR